MMEESDEIQNPWAVYCYGLPSEIGRVETEGKNSLELKYSEGQLYPMEIWDPRYIKRFSTSQDAVKYFLSHNSEFTRERLLARLARDFPKALKQEKEHIAQTRPSCTPEEDKAFHMHDSYGESDSDY